MHAREILDILATLLDVDFAEEDITMETRCQVLDDLAPLGHAGEVVWRGWFLAILILVDFFKDCLDYFEFQIILMQTSASALKSGVSAGNSHPSTSG